MTERWLPIPGFEGDYEVSDQGRVKSLKRRHGEGGRILSPNTVDDAGHRQVKLSMHGRGREYSVHRLVLLAFVGPAPEGMVACHEDDDGSNNTLTNLRWDTLSANAYDSVRNGAHPMASRTHCPMGHPLEGVNIQRYHAERGWRACRACRNGRRAAAHRGVPFTKEWGDRAFDRLVAGEAA